MMPDKNKTKKLRKETNIIFDEGYNKCKKDVLGWMEEIEKKHGYYSPKDCKCQQCVMQRELKIRLRRLNN